MLHLFLELHRTLVCNTDELATVCWTSSQQVRPRALCDRSFISTIDTGEKCRRLSSTGWPSINPNYRQIIALDQPSSRLAHISARASSWLPSRRSAVLVSCAESYRAIDVQPGAGNGLSPASSSMHETSCATDTTKTTTTLHPPQDLQDHPSYVDYRLHAYDYDFC